MRKKAQDHKAGRQAAEPVPRMRIAQLEGEQADLEAALKRAKQRIAHVQRPESDDCNQLERTVANWTGVLRRRSSRANCGRLR